MPLPQLNVPIHELTIPSTEEKITYRPFLVKEEKILLMANEGNDPKEILRAMSQIIHNCIITPENIDIENYPLFDIEYIFLKLRSKSINEISKVGYECPECNEVNEVEIQLDQIEITKNENHNLQIELTDNIGLLMKYPTMSSSEVGIITEEGNLEGLFEMLSACIDGIYENEEVHNTSDYTKEELTTFIESLTQQQFENIQIFFDTMPKLIHYQEYSCSKCNYNKPLQIDGLQNFFQ